VTTNSQPANPFALPPRSAGSASDGAEYDRKEFKQWVEDLPIGHVGQTSRDLHKILDRLGVVNITPIERFEALEMVQPPLRFVLDALTGHYLLDPLPLPKRERLIARLRQDLMVKCVVAYKVVLEQFHDESFTGYLLHKHARAEALRRVLFYLGQLLLHSYQLYQEVPPYIWREIHGIYHYAVENELYQRDPLRENGTTEPDALSAEGLYKQILLLALAGPYQLMKGDVQKVYSALKKWVAAVDLIPLKGQPVTDTGFVVDVLSDHPPSPYGSQSRKQISNGWLLGTERLHKVLDTALQDAAEGSQLGAARPIQAAGNLSADLVAKLALVWGLGLTRRGKRSGVSGKILMTCGIEAMYASLGGELQPNMTEQRLGFKVTSDEEPMDSLAGQHLARDEYVIDAGSDLNLKVAEPEPGSQTVTERAAEEPETAKVCTKICTIVDHSSNGYHLTFSGGGDSRVRVGELVGLRSASADNSKQGGWRLGVIRWLQAQKAARLAFGVEMFEGEIKPISIRRERAGSSVIDYWCGFQEQREDGRSTLILPTFYATDGDRLYLSHNGDAQTIRLQQALQRTDSFVQLWYEELSGASAEKVQVAAASEPLGQGMDNDFESIWQSLH
jgi:hypothetical protein